MMNWWKELRSFSIEPFFGLVYQDFMDLAKNPHFAKTYMVLNARNTGFGEEFKTA